MRLVTTPLLVEIGSGLVALILTAMAFTSLSSAEGLPSQAMQRECMTRAKRLFWVAGGFWAVCFVSFLCAR
jgi:hypothetical protein